MSLKILQATLGFLPAVGWGGPVKVTYQNSKELQRRGHHVTVITSNLLNKSEKLSPTSFAAKIEGLPVHYLETHTVPWWPGTVGPTLLASAAKTRLRDVVAEADVIHVNGTRNAVSMGVLQAAIAQAKPVVLQPHGTLQYIVSSLWLKRIFDRVVMRPLMSKIDRFIALQATERQQIIGAGADDARIVIVPNGIQGTAVDVVSRRGRFRQRYGIEEGQLILLFLARINRKKGGDLLVKAFASLPEALRRSLTLVIAGPDDGQLNEIEALISQYALEERTVIPGLIKGEDVWDAYADAALFILPCRTDTFPIALLEACVAEVPIIVTDGCEIADLLNGRAGRAVGVDPLQIAQAIEAMMADPSAMEGYREGAKALVTSTFSIEAVADQLESLYGELLSAS